MDTTAGSNERSAPARRRSKRDVIVAAFQRQERHVSPDELVELARQDDERISRATVYRTLQWMVDAGLAHRIEFDGGRVRFEHSLRRPRLFHLICKRCNRSFEFLSSDIESLIEEVAARRGFAARESVLQIYGTCEDCRADASVTADPGARTESLFARDALRAALAMVRGAGELYRRAAAAARDRRVRAAFLRVAGGQQRHESAVEARYAELLTGDPLLDTGPAASATRGVEALLSRATADLASAADDAQRLAIAMRAGRGLQRWSARHARRFDESPERALLRALAAQQRGEVGLLVREHRGLVDRVARPRAEKGRAARPGPEVVVP